MPPRPEFQPARVDGRRDPIVVVGGSARTLDLLRLATIRSDDIMLIGSALEPAVRRFSARFAIEMRERPAEDRDVADAAAVLVSIGDVEAENRIVRAARRHGVPVFVQDRALVSDFTLIEMLEDRPLALAA